MSIVTVDSVVEVPQTPGSSLSKVESDEKAHNSLAQGPSGAPFALTPKPTSAPVDAIPVEVGHVNLPETMTPRLWLIMYELILMCLGVMYIESSVIPALPVIQKSFPDNANWVPWILSSYNIVGAVWTALSGCIADMYGPKWILIANMSTYCVGQIVAALSKDSIFVLIAGRALQGCGMTIVVLSLTVIKTRMPKNMAGPLMGAIMAMFTVGMSIGIIGGAAALEKIKWYTQFWIIWPIISVHIVMFGFTLQATSSAVDPNHVIEMGEVNTKAKAASNSTGAEKTPTKKRTDYFAAVLLSVGVVTFLMSLTFSSTWGWKNAGTIILIIVGILCLIGLVFWEFHIKNPLIPVRILATPAQLSLCAVAIFTGILQFSLFEMLPYLYESPILSFKITKMITVGLLLLPFGVVTLLATPLTVVMGRFTGYGLAVFSANLVTSLGVLLMIWYHHSNLQAVVLNCLAGGGSGMSSVAVMSMLGVITEPANFGSVSGANMLLRFVGGSLGPVIVTLILDKNTVMLGTTELYTDKAYKNGFIFLSVAMLLATASSLALPKLFMAFTKKGRAELSARGWSVPAGH